jgi:Taurine catabolism dioxygenase TauD, TfdA family
MNDGLPLVTDASAWKGADFRNDESWIYMLSAPEVEELATAARQCLSRGLGVTDISVSDFPLKSMAPTIAGWAEEINHGRGFLLAKGLPKERFSDDEVRAMFWGIGLYLGAPVSQNSYGEMLGNVYDEGVKLHTGRVRGYRTNQRLLFHSDRCDMVGLLCVRQARAGGLSSLVSSTRVWNEIVQNHPEYMQPLMNGYIYVSVEEGGDLAPRRIPVYSVANGVVSCRILRNTIESARRMGHAKYDELETAALKYMDGLVNRDDLRLDMMLERGDMQFINNYTTLHARTQFEDYPEPARRRWMVRLWLRSFGLRRPRRAEHFGDYDGVEKTLNRKSPAGAV